MIQRGGQVVIRMLANVKRATIQPFITAMIESGTLVYTDEYAIYNELTEWGYGYKSVCHGAGEYARDEDGDGFHEVHVNTMQWKQWKSSGHCCALGYGLTEVYHKSSYRCIWVSSSACTTSGSGGKQL